MKSNIYKPLFDRKAIPSLAGLALGLIASTYLGHQAPKYISTLYESFNHADLFNQALTSFVFLIAGEYLVRLFYLVMVNIYVKHVLLKVRGELYQEWLLAQGSGIQDRYPMGEVLARLMNDTESIKELITSGSFSLILDVSFIISGLLSFMALNSKSGVVLIVVETAVVFLLLYLGKFMAKVFTEVRHSTGKMSRTLADVSGGIEESYYAPRSTYIDDRCGKNFDEFLKFQLKANIWDAGYYSFAESLYPVLLAILVWSFPYTQMSELVVIGTLLDLIQRSITPIKELASKITNWQRAKTGLVRLQEFRTELDKWPKEQSTYMEEEFLFNKLEFSLPHFSYPQKSDFSLGPLQFEAHRGELLGIVGLSGSGKSTLLKILSAELNSDQAKMNLENQQGETIVFDYKDEHAISRYRQKISIVSQDSHVFSTTLRFNITLGRNEEKFDLFWTEVQQEISYLGTWGIGAESEVKPKELSLGQKQLICTLRACFLIKPVVLFDEIASGLDSELEWALRKLILKLQKEALTIIVAHRLETVAKADRLILMEAGKILDIGPHQELLAKSDRYAQLVSDFMALEGQH